LESGCDAVAAPPSSQSILGPSPRITALTLASSTQGDIKDADWKFNMEVRKALSSKYGTAQGSRLCRLPKGVKFAMNEDGSEASGSGDFEPTKLNKQFDYLTPTSTQSSDAMSSSECIDNPPSRDMSSTVGAAEVMVIEKAHKDKKDKVAKQHAKEDMLY